MRCITTIAVIIVSALSARQVPAEARQTRAVPPNVSVQPGARSVSKAGVTGAVLWPYRPLQVRKNKVSIWNKDLRLGPNSLPESITVKGKEILAGPIRLEMKRQGRALAVAGSLNLSKAEPARVTFQSRGQNPLLQVSTRTMIEQDGMMRFDVGILPQAGTLALDGLALVIPMRPEYAKYLHHCGGAGAGANSLALRGPWSSATIAYNELHLVYLCNEEAGLELFWESDEGVNLHKPGEIVQVTPGRDETTLRFNLLDHPLELTHRFSFTFGLEASPVRPIRPGQWARTFKTQEYFNSLYRDQLIEQVNAPLLLPLPPLTYPARGNINPNEGTLEVWVRMDFGAQEVAEERTRLFAYQKWLEPFLTLELADGNRIKWRMDDRTMSLTAQVGDESRSILDLSEGISKGVWHHLAVVWGEEIGLYVDGRLAGARKWQGLFGERVDLADGYITFRGPFVLDELRISRKSRKTFSSPQPLAAEADTLLLDRFSESFIPDWQETTVPEKGTGGVPYFGMSFVDAEFGRGVKLYAGWKGRKLLDVSRESGIKTLTLHQDWTDIQAYFQPGSPMRQKQLHSVVRAAHERGVRVALYFGFEMSDRAPEFAAFGERCLLMPKQPVYTVEAKNTPVPQNTYIVCLNSPWAGIMADGLERLFREYHIDGVYLDSSVFPFPCTNRQHGCGYAADDGKTKSTWPFFAVREAVKRLYAIALKYRGELAVVDTHQSGYLGLPTLAYTTGTYSNEPIAGILRAHPEKRFLDVASLDTFRCELMGHNVGVPNDLLLVSWPEIWDGMTLALLHDMQLRMGWIIPEHAIWNSVARFVDSSTRWIPYWRSERYLRCEPQGIQASLYLKPSGEALLVVANLTREDQLAKVILNPSALRIGIPLVASGAITHKPMKVTDHILAFPLRKMGVKLIHLRGLWSRSM